MPTDTSPATPPIETTERLHELARELLARLEEIRTEAREANRKARKRWVYPELGEGSYYALAIAGDWQAAAVAAALERLPESLEAAIEPLQQALDGDTEAAREDVLPLLVGAWEDQLASQRRTESDGSEG